MDVTSSCLKANTLEDEMQAGRHAAGRHPRLPTRPARRLSDASPTPLQFLSEASPFDAFLAADPFQQCQKLGQADMSAMRLLVLHGDRDEIIPLQHGQDLYNACASSAKVMKACEDDARDCEDDVRDCEDNVRDGGVGG